MKRTRAEVLSSRSQGAHHTVTIVAPEIAERAQAGQFVHVAMPDDAASLLRHPFPVAKASRQGGWAGTVDFVVGRADTPATIWLRTVRAHGFLDVIGPLGKPFAPPKTLDTCLLIGEGSAAGQLYFLADALKTAGKRVDMILSGATHDDVYKPIEGKRVAQSVAIVTADGSLGVAGGVGQVLTDVIDRHGTEVIYAAGPPAMLREISAVCHERRIPAQVAVDADVVCGWGQCFTCAVPAVTKAGGVEMLRACTEGPVFNSSRIAWHVFVPETAG